MPIIIRPGTTNPGGDPGGQVTLPPAPVNAAFGLTLTGGDGLEWDLVNGPVRMLTGVQAFDSPAVSHWWQTSPARDGSRWDGMRTAAADVILAVGVVAPDWQSWRDADASLFRSIHPARECQLTVTAPDGVARTRVLRFVSGGGIETTDPLTVLFASYALEFTAADPFWSGEDLVAVSFSGAALVPFLVPPGPPIFLNSPNIMSGATVSNPGDEPVWPRYTVTGPATHWQVGVGDALLSSTTPLAAGSSISIDTDPAQLTVVGDDGSNQYGALNDDSFASIPALSEVPLSLALDGVADTSAVEVSFTPRYRRPW